MRRHRRVGPVAHTALRPGFCSSSVLCSVHIWPSPAHTGPLHCAQGPVPAPFSAQLCAHLAQPCAHRCSAHTAPALHTECPAPRSQDAALSVLDNKRFETLDTRFESIDTRFNGIDGRLDKILKESKESKILLESVSASVSQSLKYLKSVDKYLKSFVTHRWVKSLTVSSSVSFLLLTGLSRILTPARVFQADLLSLVGVVFASCFGIHFGMTFKSYGDEKPTEDLQ